MKLYRNIAIGLLAGLGMMPVRAQLQILPAQAPLVVFAGDGREISMLCRNASDKMATMEVRARVWQTTSTTAAPCGEVLWGRLQALPQQTVLESARLDFPSVKVETRFLVQWLTGTNRVLGTTAVDVYPTNLLAALKPLLGDAALGVFDPQNELKPVLENCRLKFEDLGLSNVENFTGRLVIFRLSPSTLESSLRELKLLVQKHIAVVYIGMPWPKEKLVPSFYSLPTGTNAVVFAQPDLVADLPKNPRAQINLIGLCRQALQPENVSLVSLSR